MLRRLDFQVLRRLDGLLQGDHRSLMRGGGIDLADLREYQLHDDVRHIDWNVTARLQSPYVRQYNEDRDLSAWFLLDLSGSVDFGSDGLTKLALGTGFVGAIARLLTRRGNRVGAVLYGERVDTVLQASSARRQVLDLIARMQQPRPPTPGRRGATALSELLQAGERLIRRRSLIFVVSDFIAEPGWAEVMARLARRHEVIAVRLLDPLEQALPDIGLVTLEDAETGEQLLVDAADPAFRERYAALAEAAETRTLDALMRSGADTLELATDDDLLECLLRFVELRRRRARQAAPTRFPAHLRAPAGPVPAAQPAATVIGAAS